MTNAPSPFGSQSQRPVLLWREDSDESRVEPTVERAALFLDVPPDSIVAAISSGQVIGGWFVDWEAAASAS